MLKFAKKRFCSGLCVSRPPTLCLAPGHGPQFIFTDPGPKFIFTGPGSQFVFTGPDPQFVFTGPDPHPRLVFTIPGQDFTTTTTTTNTIYY